MRTCRNCGARTYPYEAHWRCFVATAPKRKTAPALDGNRAVGTPEEERSPIYTTAPDPDAWSTHDQIEWMESY